MKDSKLYIAVLDDVPDDKVPTLVAHSVLGAHIHFTLSIADFATFHLYSIWVNESFKKCVVRVNQKEFDEISKLPYTYLGHENKTLCGEKSCAVVCPLKNENLPNVLKFAKLWAPRKYVVENL